MTSSDDIGSWPLPCGRDEGRLVEVIADGRAEPTDPEDAAHVRGCEHCTDALDALRARWRPVPVAAGEPVPVPAGLVQRSLDTVRAVRGGLLRRHVESAEQSGVLRVAETVVTVLARRLAQDVLRDLPGVRLRGVDGPGPTGADGLRVRIAVPYGVPLRAVGDRVASTLHSALVGSLGQAAPTVRAHVEEVLDPPL